MPSSRLESRPDNEGALNRKPTFIAVGETAGTKEVGGSGKVPLSAKRMSLPSLWATGLLESMHSGGCSAWWVAGWPTQVIAVTTARRTIQTLQMRLGQYRLFRRTSIFP
jgi:hypothetical protein